MTPAPLQYLVCPDCGVYIPILDDPLEVTHICWGAKPMCRTCKYSNEDVHDPHCGPCWVIDIPPVPGYFRNWTPEDCP